MISLIYYAIIVVCILALTGVLFRTVGRLEAKSRQDKSLSMEEYLFKISRIAGHSEYDVFCKSADDLRSHTLQRVWVQSA